MKISNKALDLAILLSEGKSVKECAKIFNCSLASVYSVMRANGIHTKSVKWNEENVRHLMENYNGRNARQLALYYGTSAQVIHTTYRRFYGRGYCS